MTVFVAHYYNAQTQQLEESCCPVSTANISHIGFRVVRSGVEQRVIGSELQLGDHLLVRDPGSYVVLAAHATDDQFDSCAVCAEHDRLNKARNDRLKQLAAQETRVTCSTWIDDMRETDDAPTL